MIHTYEGKINDADLNKKADGWFKNAKNGKLSLAQASDKIMQWTVDVYGINGEEALLEGTFSEIEKTSQNFLSKKELLFFIKEA